MRRPGTMVRLLLGSIFRKPVTTTYPAVRLEMPNRFRGRIAFRPPLCIGCGLCTRDCPTGAVKIRKTGDKEFEAEIDFSKCIYCAQCVDVCPKKALEATADFELAELGREALTNVFSAEPPAGSPPEAAPDSPPRQKP